MEAHQVEIDVAQYRCKLFEEKLKLTSGTRTVSSIALVLSRII